MALAEHYYSDYVLQKALQVVSDQTQKALLVARMRSQLATLRRTSGAYSKHLASSEWWSMFGQDGFDDVGGSIKVAAEEKIKRRK